MLIGLYSSVMQSGKSEVGRHLVDRHGFVLVKFAGPLKAAIAGILRYLDYTDSEIEEMLEGGRKEEIIPLFNKTVRQLLQWEGEAGREDLDQDVWVRIAATKIGRALEAGRDVVVDDVRRLNELTAINLLGGVMAKVYRPSASPYSGHASEGALDHVLMPWTIVNDGSYDDLYRNIDQFLKEAPGAR